MAILVKLNRKLTGQLEPYCNLTSLLRPLCQLKLVQDAPFVLSNGEDRGQGTRSQTCMGVERALFQDLPHLSKPGVSLSMVMTFLFWLFVFVVDAGSKTRSSVSKTPACMKGKLFFY